MYRYIKSINYHLYIDILSQLTIDEILTNKQKIFSVIKNTFDIFFLIHK